MTEPDRTDARGGDPAERSPVRPYTLTRGRTASREALPPETVVTAAEPGGPGDRPPRVPPPPAGELRALAQGLRGPVWLPGDEGFDAEIAASSATVVHRPHAVVGVRDGEDVAAVVRFAAERGLPVAVQATGHGAVAPVRDGLLVSTRRMRELVVDPARRTARVGAGVVWSEVISEAARHGLAPLCGSAPGVGVVGHTLGGGLSPIARTYGYTADHVRAVELVTADGRAHRADAENEPELFWAVRGGKGNFGVVTTLVLDLLEIFRFYGGGLFYRGTDAGTVLRRYLQWAPGLPERTTTSIALSRVPGRRGPAVHLRVAHVGDPAEGARLLEPMRELGPAADTVAAQPFTAVGTIHDDPTGPMAVWEGGALLAEVPEAAVAALLAATTEDADDPLLGVELRQLGGALARSPAVPNSVGGRGAAYCLSVLDPPGTEGAPADDAVAARGRRLLEALAPFCTGGAALNFLGSVTDTDRVATAWDAQTYRRLAEAKGRWDPGNLFRFGHAIPPPDGAGRSDAVPGGVARAGPGRSGALAPEAAAIVELCRPWCSVAEVAAHLHLPLGVVRVLIQDLDDAGLVHIHPPSPGHGEDTDQLERALRELRKRI